MTSREILIGLAVKYHGDWETIYTKIKNKETEDLETPLITFADSECSAVTILDEEYPEYLKNKLHPPFVLFFKGDLSILNNKNKFSFVSTYHFIDTYTKKVLFELEDPLSNKFTQVFNMGAEIDSKALDIQLHRKDFIQPRVFIPTNGMRNLNNSVKFEMLKGNTLVVNTYLDKEDCNPGDAHRCSAELQAQLLDIVVMLSFSPRDMQSGIILTHCMDTHLFCVPGSVFDDCSCNKLISEGMIPIYNLKHACSIIEDELKP